MQVATLTTRKRLWFGILVCFMTCLPAINGYAGSQPLKDLHFVVVFDDDPVLCRQVVDLYNQDLKRSKTKGGYFPTPDYETRYPDQFRKIGLRPVDGQKAADQRISYRISLPGQGFVTLYKINRWFFHDSLPELVILPKDTAPEQVEPDLDALDLAVQQPPPSTLFPYDGSDLLTQWPHFAEMLRRKQAGQNPSVVPEMNGSVRDALFHNADGYVLVSSQVYAPPERYGVQNVVRIYRLAGDPLKIQDLCYLTIAPSELLDITQEK